MSAQPLHLIFNGGGRKCKTQFNELPDDQDFREKAGVYVQNTIPCFKYKPHLNSPK